MKALNSLEKVFSPDLRAQTTRFTGNVGRIIREPVLGYVTFKWMSEQPPPGTETRGKRPLADAPSAHVTTGVFWGRRRLGLDWSATRHFSSTYGPRPTRARVLPRLGPWEPLPGCVALVPGHFDLLPDRKHDRRHRQPPARPLPGESGRGWPSRKRAGLAVPDRAGGLSGSALQTASRWP